MEEHHHSLTLMMSDDMDDTSDDGSVFSEPPEMEPVVSKENERILTRLAYGYEPYELVDPMVRKMSAREKDDAYLFNTLGGQEMDVVAYIIHKLPMTLDNYKYDSKINILYSFDSYTGLWIENNVNYFNRMINQTELDISNLKRGHLKYISDDPNKIRQKNIKKRFATIQKRLRQTTFFNNVRVTLNKTFLDNNFRSNLNPLTNWIPCSDNKLINVLTGVTKDRTSRDYYTKTIAAKYIQEWKEDKDYDTSKHKIWDILRSMMCGSDECVRGLLTLLGVFISGNVSDKTFGVLLGVGGNGKSALIKILKRILSAFYCRSLSKNIIFRPKSSKSDESTHTGNMKPFKTCYLLTSEDIEDENKKMTINMHLVKSITGGDGLFYRGVGQDADDEDLNVRAHLLIQCNDMFELPSDQALLDRLIVVSFNAKYTANLEDVNPEEHIYQSTKDLEDSLTEDDLDIFFSMMVDAASEWKSSDKELIDAMPESFKLTTREIKRDANQYKIDHLVKFIETYYTVDKELDLKSYRPNGSELLFSDFYEKYLTWYKDVYLVVPKDILDPNPRLKKPLAKKGIGCLLKDMGLGSTRYSSKYYLFNINPKD